ncbi:sigma 54-interacting transcriptional regulator [Anaerovorax odorimutans]|uniref:Sigma 54-interacting transcriptional regulator n=1 Tax=Anaerovorax odorimutans TaxID=109327 RepID=A0ABT1RNP6_9FIRM|nr:sigma 54-interacting transcriptional regulator [Anaerovorax odorimutans]MCQ4636814.1 sigma 54-interacting transcriptional regulator [Anaerovorax odorimutans]
MTIYNWNGDVLTEWKLLQDNMSAKEQAWKTFMSTGRIPSSIDISPEVLSSWQRCKDRGMDPYDEHVTTVPLHVLSEKLKNNNWLIELVRPILQETADNIRDSGYRIDLYDKELCLLMRFGKKIAGQDSERRELIIGESHAEADAGTTSTNLAALLERPVQLMAYEHYKTMCHGLTCASVPIFDASGNLLIVLTVEGNCWPMHKHTLGMLVTLKYYIEYLISKDIRSYSGINEKTISSVIEMIEEPAIVVDNTGKILFSNTAAQSMLGEGWNSLIGFNCETIWGKNPFREVLNSQHAVSNRKVVLSIGSAQSAFFTTIKPITNDNGKLIMAIGVFKKALTGKSSGAACAQKFKAAYIFDNIIGKSPEMQQCVKLARETAKLDNNILILGESGTGKELFAQSIHNESNYSSGPFVPINCSAIPHSLLESELFGYVGGSFTGSKREGQVGKFEAANGGTLFLDEINSMSMEMQSKLLRTLQSKTIVRVGGTEEISIDIRIIAASNQDLWQLVKDGQFRDDLYYRINVISIYIPPLRERTGDVDLLIDNFIYNFSKQFKRDIKLNEDARRLLQSYSWPGNVRELENVLERCLVLSRVNNNNVISISDICTYNGIFEFYQKQDNQLILSDPPQDESAETSDAGSVLTDYEKLLIIDALEKYDYNIQATAQHLGIARNTLYRKIKKYGIKQG